MQLICEVNQVPDGTTKGFDINGLRLIVVNSNGFIYVYRNVCPHTGGWLNRTGENLLTEDGTMIQCAIHRALFSVDNGVCVYGPCNGKSLEPLNFSIQDGKIWCLDIY